jgi:endonuclease G
LRLSTSLIVIFLFIIFSCFSQLENYEKYMPSSTSGEIINHSYYSLSYLEEHEIPEWTIYFTNKSRIPVWNAISNKYILPDGSKPALRTDDFRPDPKVKKESAQLIDYRGSGYDRGHMVPAADMKFSEKAMSEVFYMSNMSPQHPSLNRGIWKKLEYKVRKWTLEYDSLIIITGRVSKDPITNEDISLGRIGPNKVIVPAFFYKVIIDIKRKSSIAIVMPNKRNEGELLDNICSIQDLERITGVDFFYKLSEEEEIDFEDRISD